MATSEETGITARLGDRYARWTDAIRRQAVGEFDELLDDRWFGVGHDGSTIDRSDATRFLSGAYRELTAADLEVVSHGRFHIVRGRMTGAPDSGTEVRFVALWQENDGELRCLVHHDTRVVESAFAEKPLSSPERRPVLDSAAEESAVEELTRIYDEIGQAMPAQDLVYLDGILDEAWFTTDPGGELRDKSQYMDFARAYYAPTLTFDIDELFVRQTSPFAVVSCRYNLGGKFGHGVEPNQAVRVTGIWARLDGRWQYLAQQGTFIP